MSKAPITPLVTPIVNILESFTVIAVIAFKIGVTVAGDVESSTVTVVIVKIGVTVAGDVESSTVTVVIALMIGVTVAGDVESSTVTVVIAFMIGVTVAGDVESSTVAVEDSPGFFIVDEVKATVKTQ